MYKHATIITFSRGAIYLVEVSACHWRVMLGNLQLQAYNVIYQM